MDLLDRLLGHDAWTTRELLHRSEHLSDEELDREFDIAHRSVRATFLHLIYNMEAWTDQMAGQPIRKETGRSVPELIVRLDSAARDLKRVARSVADRKGWDESWTDPQEDPPRQRTSGATIAHVITHSMHHRAQLLYLLRRLGVKDLPEGDVLSWERNLTSP